MAVSGCHLQLYIYKSTVMSMKCAALLIFKKLACLFFPTCCLLIGTAANSQAQTQKATQKSTAVTRIQNGFIRGAQEQNCFVFRGIPYQAPRTGSARFMPPAFHKDWRDTLDCQSFGSSSAQPGSKEHPVHGSEDGLFLNVYTPSLSSKAKMPVLVWVHGGSMIAGSGNGENGHAFADRDSIVTITINYRLGVFGFMYLGDLGPQYKTSGNNGLLDLIQALKWIKANIHRFGGDPSRVTVMGESAGAKLSSALIVAPAAKGLYSGLILESGGFQCIRDSVTAKAIRRKVMDQLGIDNPRDLLDQSTEKLISAEAAVLGGPKGTNYFGPVMDGIILQDHPYTYVDKEGFSLVHYLIGANQEESKIFMDGDKRLYHPDSTVISDWFGINYRYCLSDYKKALKRYGKTNDTLAATSVLSQYMYQMHTGRLATSLAAAGRSTWVYRYQYPPAHHGSELRYVWYSPERIKYTEEEQAFGKALHQYWVQFIRTGRPGIVNNINWGPYRSNSKNVMLLKKEFSLQKFKQFFNNPRQPSACFLLN